MAMLDLKISRKLVVGDKIVVVYDTYKTNDRFGICSWNNVCCYDKDENFLWQISDGREQEHWFVGGMDGDSFAGVTYDEDGLTATNFSGNVYKIDIETGQILGYLCFVK